MRPLSTLAYCAYSKPRDRKRARYLPVHICASPPSTCILVAIRRIHSQYRLGPCVYGEASDIRDRVREDKGHTAPTAVFGFGCH